MDEATRLDLERMQGAWRLVRREKDGKADSPDVIKDVRMLQRETAFSFTGAASGSGASQGTFVINATQKPKTMDRMPSDGPQKGKTLPGIYELTGDTLTLCISVAGKDRPSAFASGPGSVLSVFQREK